MLWLGRVLLCAATLFAIQCLEAPLAIGPFSGRNFANNMRAEQHPRDYDHFYASYAVDGNTNTDLVAGSCSHTDGGYNTPAWWTVHFQHPLFLTGIKIYNRKESWMWYRLKDFKIFGNENQLVYDDSKRQVYNHQVIEIPLNLSNEYSSITIWIPGHRNWSQDHGVSYLTLCEVQVFAVSCAKPTSSAHVLMQNSPENCVYGTSITFGCDRGYELIGNRIITCIGDMLWSSPSPTCRAVRCPNPGTFTNGAYAAYAPCNLDDLYFTCVIHPSCIEGFKLQTQLNRTCNENGQWSNHYPSCVTITCDYPGNRQHLQYFKGNNQTYAFGHVEHGITLNARCDAGYRINGSASMTCTSEGTWSTVTPYCNIVNCSLQDLTDLSNGYYILNGERVHNGFASYQETVVVVCKIGYKSPMNSKTSTCSQDGSWTTQTSDCEIVTCLQPTETVDIKFKILNNTAYDMLNNELPFGTEVEAICLNGTLKSGSKNRFCKDDGLWDGFDPVCVSLCDAPEATNGKLQDENDSFHKVYEAGQSLLLTCTKGFETKTGQHNLTCKQDHSWSFLPVCTKIEITESEPSSQSFVIGGVIGGVVGGSIVIVVAVVVMILFYRNRSLFSKSKCKERDKVKKYTGLQKANSNTGEYAEIFETVVIKDITVANNTGFSSTERPKETTDQSSNGVYSNTETGSTNNAYYSFSAPDRIPKGAILVENLSDIVLSGETALKRFKAEFETFPEGLTEKHTEAIKLRNRGKNRYRNMYAYDETRVVLQTEREDESDYINACYIHGFQELRAYIASQGPTTEIMVDFWKMVWQTECSKIVMLTKLIEEDKAKCDQYWPESGSRQFGHVTVSLESTDIYSDFTLRTFGLKKDNCKDRIVTQFHYTAWPDKGVPKYSSSLVQFRNKVVNFPSYGKGPIVVHCSAGVGRTGTFLALDYLTKQAQETGYVDVVGTVMAFRKQRVNLVQTVEQYALIHHALVETLMLSTSALPSSKFLEAFQDLLKIDRNTGQKKIYLEFEMLKKLSPVIIDDQYVSAKYVRNRNKNRYHDVLPVEEFMPCLSVEKSRDDGYINAVFLPSYKEKRAFIITQTPLESTKEDFWKLVWEHNVHSIVMMNHISEMEQSEIYWPENGKECEAGRITVSLNGITTIEHNAVASMTIEFSEERRCVKQIQCGGWPSEKSLPSSPKVILSIMELVQSWQQQTGNKNVLVHCMNGAEKSGLYCVVSAVIDRMKIEQDVAISHVIQDMRNAREQIIPSAEQYQFCHEAVLAYIQQNETYSNFTL